MTSQPKHLCLDWFAENLRIVMRAASQLDLVFQLRFLDFSKTWVAGYAYDEPYDGTFFLESLKGEGKTAREALQQAVEKSRPVVEIFLELFEKFETPTTFELGREYYLIELNPDGIPAWSKMTKTPQYKNDRGLNFRHQSGDGLLLSPTNPPLIYEATSELENWLNEQRAEND